MNVPKFQATSFNLQLIPVKTRAFRPPRDSIYDLLEEFLPPLQDGDILIITSKVLAIHQGRCVKISPDVSTLDLAAQEADRYLNVQDGYLLAIRDNALLPNAGIDESNGDGYYVLLPNNVTPFLTKIRRRLMKKNGIRSLGVITTDSHTVPLRSGVLGISLGFCGLEPLRDYRGKSDIFGRKILFSRSNVVDSLAAIAVLIMGEGDERQPLLIIRGANFVKFTNRSNKKEFELSESNDLYGPMLRLLNCSSR